MLSVPVLAQMDAFRPDGVSVFGFVVVTIIFLLLVWLLDRPARPLAVRLIFWGLVTTIASIGYALLGVPTVAMLTPALVRIGFVLILGGVTWSVLAACCGPSVATKEIDHV